jgi:DNA-directed RNA polymerase subunit RPC12/RpoP
METVILRTFDNHFNANIALTKLRAAGIECYLKDEYTVTIDPLLSNAIGGIKLMVRKEDYEEAKQAFYSFDEYAKSIVRCPRCGGNDFITVPKKTTENYITAILSWLFSAYAVSAENVYQCTKCGYESEILPEL